VRAPLHRESSESRAFDDDGVCYFARSVVIASDNPVLSGTLPPSLFSLPRLVTIAFSGNAITGSIPGPHVCRVARCAPSHQRYEICVLMFRKLHSLGSAQVRI
jgi:hypothetical protein